MRQFDFCIFEVDDLRISKKGTLRGGWELLKTIKERYPKFKVTLFAVLGRCSLSGLQNLAREDWIEIAVHGWRHQRHEVRWSRRETEDFLDKVDAIGCCAEVFKSPWWFGASRGFLTALRERSYLYCVRNKPDSYINVQEVGIPAYCGWDCPNAIMWHSSNLGECQSRWNAEIENLLDYFTPETDFFFTSEVTSLPGMREDGYVWLPGDAWPPKGFTARGSRCLWKNI